ncbi:Rha family transcriptional regulator [Clostridium sp. CF012]|uniref:Rha family transcriptional regulator n=1 Tax=Clostridium sp. CF012 TaxID=2843319 RepID=UPI001C0BB5F0|nr:Rha family transcriptional regulator [Clostridium sp. CF012]MBU3145756.1 ORF6C domain-containing protein [Clostridium sp. CF012]
MNNLTVIKRFGELMVDSREVAEMVAREHSNLMRDIRGYVSILENSKMNSQNFFMPSTYKTEGNNKTYDCYLLTRKGCDLAANKMTGEKGVLFTAEYVTQFENMEQTLKTVQPKLSKELQAIFAIDAKTVEIDNRLVKLENNMTIDYEQQEILNGKARFTVVQVLGGKDAPAYKECSRKAFSELWRCYKRVMQVNSYKNTACVNYDKGKEIIENWKPNRDLELMILGANSQFKLRM